MTKLHSYRCFILPWWPCSHYSTTPDSKKNSRRVLHHTPYSNTTVLKKSSICIHFLLPFHWCPPYMLTYIILTFYLFINFQSGVGLIRHKRILLVSMGFIHYVWANNQKYSNPQPKSLKSNKITKPSKFEPKQNNHFRLYVKIEPKKLNWFDYLNK